MPIGVEEKLHGIQSPLISRLMEGFFLLPALVFSDT